MPMRIVIALGDATGVGPEVALKALAAEAAADDARYLLIGDLDLARRLNEQLGLHLPLTPDSGDDSARFLIHNPLPEPLPADLAPGSPTAARAALAWLTDAAQRCLRQQADALVTAPVSKEAIMRTGQPFIGQTEYLSEMAGTTQTAMMLLGEDDRGRWLRVALATTHVPLRLLANQLSAEKVELAIQLAAQSCRDLGLAKARVAVCGLNPHAGEGGKMGDEEITVIKPAIEIGRAHV